MAFPPPLYQTYYDKTSCKIGVIHVGYGAFHRTHQAVYLDDYMEKTDDLNWGIAAVNINKNDCENFAAMTSRGDDGYVLKTIDASGKADYRLVRSHLKFLDWTLKKQETEHLCALETVQAMTITVTESGYYLDKQGNLNTQSLETIYGFLATGLEKRLASNALPISILCCDNIRMNGGMLRRSFLKFLELNRMDDLATWVKSSVSFPSSMVDRITPRANGSFKQEISHLFPQYDNSPVYAEYFSQWVIENEFAGTFPKLNKVGVEIVDDVTPFEETKIRILNGGHTCLAYLGILRGFTTFDQTMADKDLKSHFDIWQEQEALPAITMNLPFDKHQYKARVTERFANTAIADSLERIAMDGVSKFIIFIKPTLESCLAQGIEPIKTYDTIASWYHFAHRIMLGELDIPYQEPNWLTLEPLLKAGKASFASSKQLWGDLPSKYPHFKQSIINAIDGLEEKWQV